MDSKISTKAKPFLFVNLLSYLLAAAIACDTCNSSSSPSPTAPLIGRGSNQGPQPSACPRDALKLGVCAKLLGRSVGVEAGNPPPPSTTTGCCEVLEGIADLEAAICLCTAIKENVMGINVNVPVTLSLLVSKCRITPPPSFVCA